MRTKYYEDEFQNNKEKELVQVVTLQSLCLKSLRMLFFYKKPDNLFFFNF